MSGVSRGAVAAVVAFLLVAGLLLPAALAGPALAQEGGENDTSASNATEASEPAEPTGPYALETLRSAGRQPPNAPVSVRALGSSTTVWLEYAPTGFMRSDEPDQREDVAPDTTVRRDTVYFRSSRPWDASDEKVELVVVYYEEGEVERTTAEGQVVRERAAVNQTVDRHNLTLSSGYDVHEINLRKQYDEEIPVAMFLEGREGDIQWSFNQVSSQASRGVNIATAGDAASWAFVWMFLPFSLTLLGVLWGDRKLLKRARAGPQYRTTEYVGLAFIGGFFGLLFAYEWAIDLISRAPWALGVAAGLGFGLIVIELFGDDTYKDLFIRFVLDDAETRQDGSGIMRVEAVEKKMVDLEDDRKGVIENGLKAFVARARGAIPVLDTGPLRRETQMDVDGKWRNLHLVDPTAEEALEYEAPEWSLDVITFDRETDAEGWLGELVPMVPRVDVLPVCIGLGVVYAGYALSAAYLGTGMIGFLVATAVVLGWWASPHGGRAIARLAPVHFDAVVANVLMFAKGLEETADRDFYRRKYHEEQGSNLAQRKAEREDSETSRFEAIMNEYVGDVDDQTDSEVAPADD